MKTFIAHEIPTLKRVDGPNGRVYQTPTGKAYPSVTSVTGLMGKDDFFAWRARVGEEEANRVSARAARRGTAIHSLCEDYLYGKNPVPTMFDAQVFNSIRPHLDLIDNIHALESKLYSDHLQVAGTVDCIAEYKGKRAVIDFKTSKRIKEAKDISGYFMQTAAYAVAFEERTGIAIPRLVIIM
jgi:genome maintenance exonuclease 1